MPNLLSTGLSDVGRKRTQNQDSYLLVPEQNLFIVADGMGGHRGGEVASKLSVETISKTFANLAAVPAPTRVLKSMEMANKAIRDQASHDPGLSGMGTTTVTMLFEKDHLYLGHVGDSRCYLFQPNRWWQLTPDHSLVQEKLKAGIISRQQLKTDRMKHVLTRSVGVEALVQVDVFEVETHPGDLYLSCSDGLSGLVTEEQIQEILTTEVFSKRPASVQNLENAARRLIEAANNNGGDDNVTAVLVEIL